MQTLTAAEFNRSPSLVKRRVLRSKEPVLVTDRAEPSLVVMKYIDYVHLTQRSQVTDLAEWLEMTDEIDFDPTPIELGIQAVDL